MNRTREKQRFTMSEAADDRQFGIS